MKTQDSMYSMLMQMHEMQLDHDPDIAPIDIILLIAQFGIILLIAQFDKIVLIDPFGKMILITPFGQMTHEYESSYWQMNVNRSIWHL